MNKKILLFVIIVATWSFSAFGQKGKFYGQVEIGYMNGFGNINYHNQIFL